MLAQWWRLWANIYQCFLFVRLLAQCSRRSADIDLTLVQPHEGRWGFLATVAREWSAVGLFLHRALCSLFQPDTDGWRVSKCRQLSQQTRRLDPMLFQCWSSAVGGGQILKQYWLNSLVFAWLHTGVRLHQPLPRHNILASRSGYF